MAGMGRLLPGRSSTPQGMDTLITRRHALAGLAALLATRSSLAEEVAGIRLPQSPLARAAAEFSRRHCPEYLFNHCMRTFLFGAVALGKQQVTYDADKAFAAAALHDLGLLPEFESPSASFEIDGANRAEQLMLQNGLSARDADVVWHAIVL